jgi:hypothetical protein
MAKSSCGEDSPTPSPTTYHNELENKKASTRRRRRGIWLESRVHTPITTTTPV